jgi:hypothetical protein
MNAPKWLPGVVLCIGIMIISINFWYLVYVPSKYKMEGFSADDIHSLASTIVSNKPPEKIPTDVEAAQSYRNLLLFMKENTLKSVKIINDFNMRVYGTTTPVPDTFDPRTLLDNFKNPITGM